MNQGNFFESVIVSLPEMEGRKNPTLRLVVFARVTNISALIIWDINKEIMIETLKKVGTGTTEKFNNLLKIKDIISRRNVEDNITKLHIVKKKWKKSVWVNATFYCYGIWIELKHLIMNKYVISNK